MMGHDDPGRGADARAGEGQGLRQQGRRPRARARCAGLSDSDLVKVDAGDIAQARRSEIKFLHTPGHTPGSQCFLVEGNLISGDTLFVNSCGRVDLPGSDPEAMYYSLNHTLRNLDDTTVVYPGHAYSSESSTTIGAIRSVTNMYMRFPSLDDFLDAMGYARR